MENHTNYDSEDTAASFEKPARRYGLLAGFAAIALAAGLAGGYALNGSGQTALAIDATTSTNAGETEADPLDQASGSGAEPFDVELGDDDEAEQTPEPSPTEADDKNMPAPKPDPAPEPAPAELAVDDTVDAGTSGEGTFAIHNLGDEDMDIDSVQGPASVTFSDVPVVIGGGDSADVKVTVDTAAFGFGSYELEVQVNTSAGSETVTVTGTKEAVIVLPPPSPDIDVQDQVVVPHLTPIAPIKVWNNEDQSVKVTLESLHPRLTLPAEANLVPGENVIIGAIAPYAVQPQVPMALTFEVSWWLGSEQATVLKFGQ